MERGAWWTAVQRVTKSQIHVFWVLTPYQICDLEIFVNEATCSWSFFLLDIFECQLYLLYLPVDISFYHYVFSFVSSKTI